MTTKNDPIHVGKRLKALRFLSGFRGRGQQKIWAEIVEATQQQYNNWERGKQIITVPAATQICARTGATLDYIYLGKSETLPFKLAVSIEELFSSGALDSKE